MFNIRAHKKNKENKQKKRQNIKNDVSKGLFFFDTAISKKKKR